MGLIMGDLFFFAHLVDLHNVGPAVRISTGRTVAEQDKVFREPFKVQPFCVPVFVPNQMLPRLAAEMLHTPDIPLPVVAPPYLHLLERA